MTVVRSTAPFDRQLHGISDFDCGKPPLNTWLQRYAGQGQRRDTARTFVVTRTGGGVDGYYTLVAGQVERTETTDAVGAGTSAHFPIPVCLIARLAVDRSAHGQGLGAALLLDGLQRILVAAEHVGIRAVVVDAIDDDASRFYRHFGFVPVTDEPRTLMVPLQAVRTMLGSGR